MPSTYTSNNKIQKIATGEQSGTWGNTTNTNFDLFDSAIDGFATIALTGTTGTLSIPDGSAGNGRNKVLSFTGTLAATNTVSVTPNTVKKHYFVQNNTTGGQNVVLSQGSGSTVTIKPGYSSIVYLDGAGSGAAVKEVLTSLKLTALLEATGVVFVGSSSGNTTLQATAAASGTLTLPAATDTIVGKATTDTFTNKTFDTAGTGNVLRINGTQVSAVTGTGSVVLATSPTLVTPLLGTPTSGTLTNCTGLPISTGVSGLATGIATFLATPSSANLAAALTDETGTGANVFANTPTLVTPILGTPTSGTLTNCTGLPVSSGISGLGTGVATFLATPSSANLAAAVTDETGSGALVFGTSPTIATPTITTSATVPLVIGGTGTTSTLTLRSTSGVGTTGADIIFQVGNNGATEVMRLQNGGNVGIATPSPQTLLTVGSYNAGTGEATTRGYIQIQDPLAAATLDASRGLEFKTSPAGSGYGWKMGGVNSGVDFAIGNRFNSATFSERVRINFSGNVGIGTSNCVEQVTLGGYGALAAVTGNTYGYLTHQFGSDGSDYYSVASNWRRTDASTGTIHQPLLATSEILFQTGSVSVIRFATASSINTAPSERMRIDSVGNFKVGGTADRATTAGTNQVVIFDGTAPVGTLANGCSFYSTAGEMRVMDAAGNATLLSPHDSQTNEWIYDSSHTPTGRRLKIDVERLLRFLNEHFGLDCVHDFIQEN